MALLYAKFVTYQINDTFRFQSKSYTNQTDDIPDLNECKSMTIYIYYPEFQTLAYNLVASSFLPLYFFIERPYR